MKEDLMTCIDKQNLNEAVRIRQRFMNWEITKKQYDQILFNLWLL